MLVGKILKICVDAGSQINTTCNLPIIGLFGVSFRKAYRLVMCGQDLKIPIFF